MVNWNLNKLLLYKAKRYFYSRKENTFRKVLNKILDQRHYEINSKVKLLEFIEPTNETSKKYIETQHIDFLILDKNLDFKPVLAIELDGESHNKEKQIKSDNWKNRVINDTSIPLSRFEAKHYYDIKKIKDEIYFKLSSKNNNEVYIDNSQISDTEQPERYNNNSIWIKSKDFFYWKAIPTIIAVVVFIIILPRIIPKILFQNTLKNIQQKTLPIPAQPQIPRENIIISNPKIKVKVRIAGKYISENKSYVMYERIDTRKQKNVTIEDFLKMCECSAKELYIDRLMEIVE